MSSSLSLIDKKRMAQLPFPIANLWKRVHDVKSDREKFSQLVGTLDVFLRYTSGLIFAAYLRHPSCTKVESEIEWFFKKDPSVGRFFLQFSRHTGTSRFDKSLSSLAIGSSIVTGRIGI